MRRKKDRFEVLGVPMEESALSEVVSSPTRLKIADLLSVRPRTLKELSQATGISVQAVLKHLAKLEELGLLQEASLSGPGARKAYSLKGHSIGDFSVGGLTVVKLSEDTPVVRESKKPAQELERLAVETLVLRRRVRGQTRKLGRMIDELVENQAALRSLLGSLKISDEDRMILRTVFTEETMEDAEKALRHLGLPDPKKSIDRALAKAKRGR